MMCCLCRFLCCFSCCSSDEKLGHKRRHKNYTELGRTRVSGFSNRTTVSFDRQQALQAASSPSNLPTLDLTIMYDLPDNKYKTVDNIIDYHGFQLLNEELGRGGVGVVYKGRRKIDNSFVAIKVMDISGKYYKSLKADAKNELFVMQKTSHPYIIQIYSHFIVRYTIENITKVYIMMRLAENKSLSEYVRQLTTGMDEIRAKRMFAQIVSAVSHMHSFGIAHSDLKMGNILLDKDMNVLVSDFGLSRVNFREKKGGVIMSTKFMGTVPYMAPEILNLKLKRNTQYNPFITDVWALGIILFIIINRYYPFGGENCKPGAGGRLDKPKQEKQCFTEMIKKMQSFDKNPSQPFNRYMKASPEFEDIIRRLFTFNPDKRITIRDLSRHPWISQEIDSIKLQFGQQVINKYLN
ncbi:testis-specific serine/threonine-protein kinase 2-like [Oppia nitens]|uniref:testis-specific serine/threonine-protein kinase 2-like n=1 Tax=Oppia nitens TaxID=1686743 RepID=UPI0023DBC285|nr:testis-specific serine/threonine-protein kinase 2-like [Oppia nitens]